MLKHLFTKTWICSILFLLLFSFSACSKEDADEGMLEIDFKSTHNGFAIFTFENPEIPIYKTSSVEEYFSTPLNPGDYYVKELGDSAKQGFQIRKSQTVRLVYVVGRWMTAEEFSK